MDGEVRYCPLVQERFVRGWTQEERWAGAVGERINRGRSCLASEVVGGGQGRPAKELEDKKEGDAFESCRRVLSFDTRGESQEPIKKRRRSITNPSFKSILFDGLCDYMSSRFRLSPCRGRSPLLVHNVHRHRRCCQEVTAGKEKKTVFTRTATYHVLTWRSFLLLSPCLQARSRPSIQSPDSALVSYSPTYDSLKNLPPNPPNRTECKMLPNRTKPNRVLLSFVPWHIVVSQGPDDSVFPDSLSSRRLNHCPTFEDSLDGWMARKK